MIRWNKTWALAKKDIKEYTKSKYVFFSIVFIPFVFSLLMAFSGVFPLLKVPDSEFSSNNTNIGPFFNNLMSKIIKNWGSLDAKSQVVILTAYSMLFFVALVPLILPAIIASETVVGEKERKTMESLLASPLSEKEIVMGKIVSAFLPSIASSVLTSTIYAITIDWMLWPIIHRLLFPDPLIFVFTFIISPLATILCVELMILVSTKMTNVRDAYQIGSLVIMPVFFFVFAQMFTFFYSSILSIVLGSLILIVLDIAFFIFAENVFDREKALTKMG